jgi:hypothetical protein
MYTLTINKFNGNTHKYNIYAHQQLNDEQVKLILDHFNGLPVIEGFYQLVLKSPESKYVFYTCHPNLLSQLKAKHHG